MRGNLKFILLVSISLLLFSCTNSVKNYVIPGKLFGRVKSLAYTHFSVNEKYGEVQKTALRGSASYKFNDKGKATEGSESTIDNGWGEITTYSFDDAGKVVSDVRRRENSQTIEYTTVYNYDDKGNLTDKTVNDNSKSMFTYDSRGNVSQSKVYDSRGNLSEVVQDHYDSKDQLIGEDLSDVNSSSNNRVFTYKLDGIDKHGNWTKRTLYENAKPIIMTVREIEYY